MTKDEGAEVAGTVSERLPNATFRVRLQGDHEIVAHAAPTLALPDGPLAVGDRVLVEMTAYEPGKGRITFRVR